MAVAEDVERLGLVLEGRRAGGSVEELAVLTGISPGAIRVELRPLAEREAIREAGARWFSGAAFQAARESVLEALSSAHASQPGARGMSLESLRSGIDAPADVVNAALSDLQRTGEIRVEGSTAALPDHVPRLSPEQRVVAEAALSKIRDGQASPPTVKELASSLGVRGDELLPLLKFLVDQSELVAVTADLYLDSGAISEVKQRVKAALGKGGAATPSELREALGVSRKYLIPLLEYLDGIGFTQRSGEGRVLRDLSREGY
jgi:selenocysteine-specific elongation factor